MSLPDDVQKLADLNFSVIPGSIDKQPKVRWGQWRDRPQTAAEHDALPTAPLWGVVTGQAHHLVVLDFDRSPSPCPTLTESSSSPTSATTACSSAMESHSRLLIEFSRLRGVSAPSAVLASLEAGGRGTLIMTTAAVQSANALAADACALYSALGVTLDSEACEMIRRYYAGLPTTLTGTALLVSLGLLPNVVTGSGGAHVWVEPPPYPVKTCAGHRPSLDVRGEGGLVWTYGRSRKGAYRIQHYDRLPWERVADLLPERLAPTGDAEFGEWSGEGDGTDHALCVLRKQAETVAVAHPGTRNTALNQAAYTVGGLIAAGELSEASAARVLMDAAEASNTDGLWPRAAMDATLRSAFQAGSQSPWSAEPGVTEDDEFFEDVYTTGRAKPAPAPAKSVDLPLDAFPPEVRALVSEGSAVVSAPPQYIALSTLPALGLAIGGDISLGLKRTWRIPPVLYVGLVGKTGTSKTPAVSLAIGPAEQANIDIWDSNPDGDAKLILQDVTTERLADLLNANPRGLLYLADELKGFFSGMGQYKEGGGNDRQFYLEAWNGRSLSQARVKSKDRFVRRATLNVLGGIQPSVFEGLTYATDGMLERFLFVYSDPIPAVWTLDDVSEKTLGAYSELWNRLRDSGAEERLVPVTPAGHREFKRWHDAFEAAPGLPPHLLPVKNKVRTHVARVALILSECDRSDCDAEHFERAWSIVRYCLHQADLAYQVAESGDRKAMEWLRNRDRLLAWLEEFERTHGRRPKRGEAMRFGPNYSRRKSVLDPMLEELGVAL